jgi:hypothetical protein
MTDNVEYSIYLKCPGCDTRVTEEIIHAHLEENEFLEDIEDGEIEVVQIPCSECEKVMSITLKWEVCSTAYGQKIELTKTEADRKYLAWKAAQNADAS